MKNILLTIALLGGVAVGPVLAEHAKPIADEADSVTAAPHDERALLPPVLEGRVLAVDHDRGEFILATDAGMVTLTATLEEVADLEVGDVVVVALHDIDGESGL